MTIFQIAGCSAKGGPSASSKSSESGDNPTDTTAPHVVNITSLTANGAYRAGQTISIAVVFNEAVTATGAPQITLNTTPSNRTAIYTSGSGTGTLTFTYIVQATDSASDLDYLGTSSLVLNGGTIKDLAGNDAVLTLAAPGAAGSLGANRAIVIDTSAPAAPSSLALATPATSPGGVTTPSIQVGGVTSGDTISLFTSPTCTTASLVGTTTASAATVNVTTSALTAGTYDFYSTATDLAGNVSPCSTATVNYVLDTNIPSVNGVTSSTSNGAYRAGQSVSIQVGFNKNVVVTGVPELTLNTTPTNRTVEYVSGSGTDTLTFTYTIQATDTASDLDCLSTTALSLNGGTIKDTSSNDAALTLAPPGAAGSLGASKNIVIDTTAPSAPSSLTLSSPSSSPGLDTTPTIQVAGVESGAIVSLYSDFACTAGSLVGNATATGSSVSITTGVLPQASYTFYANSTDPAGNVSNCSLASVAYVLDTTAPTVSNVTASTANGAYRAGQSVSIQVSFNEAVVVSGTPQLALNTTPTSRIINYASGSGSSTLNFTYTIQATDTAADLDYLSTTALTLNGGTIKDQAGNNAVLTLAAPGTANSLGANKNIVIDTTAPAAPSGLALQTPGSSPGSVTTPVIRVSGVTSGDVIRLFTNGTCSTQVGSATAGATTVDITSSVLSEGAHSFYADATDTAGNRSLCSSASAAYTLDLRPTISIANVSASEGNGSGSSSFVFTVTASTTYSQDITVGYSVSDATATAGSDYTSTSGTVTITAGNTSSTFAVSVAKDSLAEPDETFSVTLSGGANYQSTGSTLSATGTIQNDDHVPTISQTCSTSATQGASYSCTPSGSDADGDSLTWSLDGANTCTWASINPSSGALSGTPAGNQVGSCDLKFKVSDGTNLSNVETVSITVSSAAPTVSFTTTTQSVSESGAASSIAWHAGMTSWSKRVKLQLLNDNASVNLVNFPVLVVLNSSRIDYTDFKTAGDDIRFIDQDGTSLSYEIEKWNTAGDSYIWVKVPQIDAASSSGAIYMYYKNAGASAGQSAASTWDANFINVWHMNGMNDSSSRGWNFTNFGSTSGTGLTGDARNFASASSQYMELANHVEHNFTSSTPYTVSTWVKATDFPGSGAKRLAFSKSHDIGTPIEIGNNNDTDLFLRSANSDAKITRSFTPGTWHHIEIVQNGSGAITVYMNGTPIMSDTGGTGTTGSGVFWVGGGKGVSQYWNGSVDELRISNIARSADWIRAEYLTSTDAFIAYAPVENVTDGAVTITAQLNTTSTSNVTIPYTVTGSATSGIDHDLASGNIVIPAGDTSTNLTFKVFRDSAIEGSESVVITMGTPTNATLAGSNTTHTVTITDGPNAAPVAASDTFVVVPDQPAYVDVLANDSDSNNDPMYLSSLTAPAHGTATIAGRRILYVPTSGFAGNDSVTYTVRDIWGATATATVAFTVRSRFHWTGSVNSTWSNAGNWVGGAAPGATDVAYFSNAFCVANCSITIPGGSFGGLVMNSDYTGTLTLGGGVNMIPAGFYQYGGILSGASGSLSLSHFEVNGGTFNAPPTITGYPRFYNSDTIFKIASSGYFNHANGSISFGTAGTLCTSKTYTFDIADNTSFSSLSLTSNVSGCGASQFFEFLGRSFNVNGTLTVGASYLLLMNGTLMLSGNLALSGGSLTGGNAVIEFTGAGAQTYSSGTTYGYPGPHLVVNKTGGSITPTNPASQLAVMSLNILKGSFTAPSGILSVGYRFGNGNSPWSIPDYTVFSVASSGATFNHNNGTVRINNFSQLCTPPKLTVNVNAASVYDLIFDAPNAGGCNKYGYIAIASPISVEHDATIATTGDTQFSGGSYLDIKGNFSNAGASYGTLGLRFSGSANQTYSSGAGVLTGNIAIAKTGGDLTLLTNWTAQSAGQTFSLAGAPIYLGAKTLRVSSLANLALNGQTIHARKSDTSGLAGALYVNGVAQAPGAIAGGTFEDP